MKKAFQADDFDYLLPQTLIAQHPLLERSKSRLLGLNLTQKIISNLKFNRLSQLLQPNDLLIFNNTKVFPARLYGYKDSGGKVECLIERIVTEDHCLAHIRASKAPKTGTILKLANRFTVTVGKQNKSLFELKLNEPGSIMDYLNQYGQVPLPPYITRKPEHSDKSRYQSIFARHVGAVAAPTASLHFDTPLIDKITDKGVNMAHITLHVGAGTFQPLRTNDLDAHQMHHEYMEINQHTCDAITKCKLKKGRVIAVGTTVVRCLETATKNNVIRPYCGETNLFIRPGFQFQTTDVLITNFHLPKSTLLMLVCAFGGHQFIMDAYQKAIDEKYRFFSYGDAMFLYRK